VSSYRGAGPLRGSGAAAPSGALRAIDASARPRLGPAFGWRRLRRQSQPDLVATERDAIGTGQIGLYPRNPKALGLLALDPSESSLDRSNQRN